MLGACSRSLTIGATTLVLLAGCAGSGVQTTPALPAMQQSVAVGSVRTNAVDTFAANSSTRIVVSDAANNVVNVYDASGNQLTQLTGFSEPQGLAVDLHGDLYVADTADSRVQVYAAGFGSAPTTLSDPGQYPAGVASYGQGAYVAVTNIISTSGGPGSVSIFKGTTLVGTIASSAIARAYFCAFDAKGNLYLDGTDSNGNVIVGEIVDATSGGMTYAPLAFGKAIAFPGGIHVTNAGDIAIAGSSASTIDTYAPPVHGSLGKPLFSTTLTGDAASFVFSKSMTDVWTVDPGNGGIGEYLFPKGGSPIKSFATGGEPVGIAVIPAQVPK